MLSFQKNLVCCQNIEFKKQSFLVIKILHNLIKIGIFYTSRDIISTIKHESIYKGNGMKLKIKGHTL
jgi:hypothetical protein